MMGKIGDEFIITEEHLKLLSNLNVFFNPSGYDGAPAVDCKRPYGNSGDVAYDVFRVLTGDYWDYGAGDEEMPEQMNENFHKLHRETATALQICLVMKEFKTGKFRKTLYGFDSWERIE